MAYKPSIQTFASNFLFNNTVWILKYLKFLEALKFLAIVKFGIQCKCYYCILTGKLWRFRWTKYASHEHSMFIVIQFFWKHLQLIFHIKFMLHILRIWSLTVLKEQWQFEFPSKALKHIVYSEVMKAWIFKQLLA